MSNEHDPFDELVGGISKEIHERLIESTGLAALKSARIAGTIIREAKDWGVPKDLAEVMGADVWQLLMIGTPVAEVTE
ncbi:hypothetical protein OG393_29390 [Streptomyces sp. NBC_01216]|uniref:hypothetical protein n=1 Tax=Streptomyces sp. NBC_01216 TaxID=2903778 RepID=UPI002E0D63C2|nr:hypothetical protein OG393_29390 [Streptomyces sp. NBC_01216]